MAGSGANVSIQDWSATSFAPGASCFASVISNRTAGGTTIRRANFGKSGSIPIRAKPISGLLSAMMISSGGTHLLLNFNVIEVDDRNTQPAQLIHKTHLAHSSQLGGFAQGELAQFEELHRKHHAQFVLHRFARLAARHEQVIGILNRQFCYTRSLVLHPLPW